MSLSVGTHRFNSYESKSSLSVYYDVESEPGQDAPQIEYADGTLQHSPESDVEKVPASTEASSSQVTNEKPEKDPTDIKYAADGLSPIREVLFLATTITSQFMTQAGLGQMLSILHVIGDSFDVENPGILAWLIAGYSLTVGTFVLFAGRLGDLFGYKRMLLIGYGWFSVWSMISGLAVYSNSVLFIFARVLQGVGPSIALTNGLAILGAVYSPGKKKNMVFAIFGASAPAGSIMGSLFSSVFALAWWPWTFWAFAIILAMLAVVGFFVIPNLPDRPRSADLSYKQLLREMDPLGALTGVTGLILVNFAWNQASAVGWQQPYVYICLILGLLVFMPLFLWIEFRVTEHPLIPFRALTVEVGFVLATVACGWSCFGIWVYYLWQYLEVCRELDPVLASVWLLPIPVTGAIAAGATGLLLSRIHPAWVMTIALAAFTSGISLLMTAPIDQIYWGQVFFTTLIMPWGMDMTFPAATVIISNAVPTEHQGIGSSLVNTVVNYSISLGLGFAGTIASHVGSGGQSPADQLKIYRAAMYLGCGLASLGFMLSLVFLVRSHTHPMRSVRRSARFTRKAVIGASYIFNDRT